MLKSVLIPTLIASMAFLMPLLSQGGEPLEKKERSSYRRPGGLKYDKYGLIDPTPDAAALHFFPKDKYDFIDWSKALEDSIISPRNSVSKGKEEHTVKFSKSILIRSKMDFMPDVLFPHTAHNRWLDCSNCHPKIFKMKAGDNPISMIAIWKGEYCGRCHDKVAFPFRNCFRCHSVPKEIKKPDASTQGP
jgi:c(7)-type cytochrome triheme protein